MSSEISLKKWLHEVSLGIDTVHEQHHDQCMCSVSSKQSIARSTNRLLRTIEAIESTGREVRCIYAVGTDIGKQIVSNTDFGKRDIKVVISRHPTSGLYDAAGAFDKQASTFDFSRSENTLREIHHLNNCYNHKYYQIRTILLI